MGYFSGLVFGGFDHVPQCVADIDRVFAYYALNFAASGRLYWRVDDGPEQILPAPFAYWTVPGPRYRYGNLPGETWDQYYVTFRGPRAEAMVREGLLPDGDGARPWNPVAEPVLFGEAWLRLFRLLEEEGPESAAGVHALEGLLLSATSIPAEAVTADPRLEGVRALQRRLREDPCRSWNFHAEARRLNLSLVHLRRLFRQQVGLAPGQFVQRERMLRAARLLRSTSEPVKRVAEQAGYDDVFYFTKIFKRQFGRPPAQYRREFRLYSTDAADGDAG